MTSRLAASRLVAPLLAADLLTTGACSEDGREDAGAPAPTRPPATDPSPSPGSPLRFLSTGRACIEFTGPTVIWEQVRVKRPVTLRAFVPAALVGEFEPGAASVAARPPGEVPFTGAVKGNRIPEKWADRVSWDDREPVADAALRPGDYYVFLKARITGPASYDGFDLTWTDSDGVEGSTRWASRDTYRATC